MDDVVPAGSNAFAALAEVRAGLHAQLDALDAQRLALQKQLRTIEASMRVVQPGVWIERRPTKWSTPEPEPDPVTQIASGTSRMLRLSGKAMTVPELVQALLEDRGIDPDKPGLPKRVAAGRGTLPAQAGVETAADHKTR